MSVAQAEGIGDTSDYPDITGVPSAELNAVYEAHLDCDPMLFAERVGIEYNYFRRLVVKPTVPVVRLKYADAILHALGLDLVELERDGIIHVVPINGSRKAAQRLVEDEISFAREEDLPVPTREEVEARVVSLMSKYADHCPLTPYQIEKRAADAARTARNREKKKGGQ